MKKISSFLLALSILPIFAFAAEKWTAENVTKMKLESVICNEKMDEEDKYGHGGYFISFPKDPIQTYMIIGLDKSDDTEHLIGGYDIRAEMEVKEVLKDKKINGEWKKVKVKVFSIESVMSKVETQIDLIPLLKVLNSDKSEKFPATLIFPTGNIQDFDMECSFR